MYMFKFMNSHVYAEIFSNLISIQTVSSLCLVNPSSHFQIELSTLGFQGGEMKLDEQQRTVPPFSFILMSAILTFIYPPSLTVCGLLIPN